MKKFEYKIARMNNSLTEIQLNAFGNNGWELVNLFIGSVFTYHFKKEIIE